MQGTEEAQRWKGLDGLQMLQHFHIMLQLSQTGDELTLQLDARHVGGEPTLIAVLKTLPVTISRLLTAG